MLWLWRRRAAEAPIQPLAWELPYAAGVALKRKKKYVKRINITKQKQAPWLLAGRGLGGRVK